LRLQTIIRLLVATDEKMMMVMMVKKKKKKKKKKRKKMTIPHPLVPHRDALACDAPAGATAGSRPAVARLPMHLDVPSVPGGTP